MLGILQGGLRKPEIISCQILINNNWHLTNSSFKERIGQPQLFNEARNVPMANEITVTRLITALRIIY